MIRKKAIIKLSVFLILIMAFAGTHFTNADTHNQIVLIKVTGAIQPSTASFIQRVVAESERQNRSAVLIELDTPGGMLEPTRKIVSTLLGSDIPIISYVTPSGARAGSAGTFIVAASHLAVMSPSTNIGAASPISSDGSNLKPTLANKTTQDAAALIRSIAQVRNRNTEALEATVFEAKAYSSEEALKYQIIDAIADNRNELLNALNGKLITTASGSKTFISESAIFVETNRTWKEKFLDAIGDPNITFILLTIGSIALTIEFVSPGILVGGFIGLLATALAFVGMGQLPVNWLALALIGTAIILFILETQGAGLGLFAVGGIICFVLGGFLLYGDFGNNGMQGDIFRISLWILGTVLVLLSILVFFMLMALREAVLKGEPSNYASIIGSEGLVRTTLNPDGTVLVGSEMWSAISKSEVIIQEGTSVIVDEYDGVRVIVSEKTDPKSTQGVHDVTDPENSASI